MNPAPLVTQERQATPFEWEKATKGRKVNHRLILKVVQNQWIFWDKATDQHFTNRAPVYKVSPRMWLNIKGVKLP